MALMLASIARAFVLLRFMEGMVRSLAFEDDELPSSSLLSEDDELGFAREQISLDQLNRLHSKCDENRDGKASLPELMQFGESVRKHVAEKEIDAVMNEIDLSPHDGHASLQEYMDDLEQHWAPHEDEDPTIVNQHIDLRNTELEKFKLADADEDGALNRTELINMVSPGMHDRIFEISTSAELRQKDTDGDGLLSEEEFWGGHPGQPGEFQNLDKNGDGTIDIEEMKLWASGWYHTEIALKQLFDLADEDKDGFLTASELEAVYTTIDTTDAHYHLLQWANNDGEAPETFMEFEEELQLAEEGEL
jgi:Ca2+-binding EF-hand superfamily protein